MADEQAVMDQEDAAAFRVAVKKLANKVRKALTEEARRKAAAKDARKERGYADAKLARLTEGDDDQAGDWLTRMASASKRAESAQEAETEARQEWVRAVFARRKTQDELRVRVRKQFERYPLIDGAAAWNGDANGHAETLETAKPSHALRSVEDCKCGPDCPRSCPCGCHPEALRDEPVEAAVEAPVAKWRGVKLTEFAQSKYAKPLAAVGVTTFGQAVDYLCTHGDFSAVKGMGRQRQEEAESLIGHMWRTGTEEGEQGGAWPWLSEEPATVSPTNIPPEADPLAEPCAKCRAAAGQKCRNYKGQNKQTCPDRGYPEQTGPHGTDPMSGPTEQPGPLFAPDDHAEPPRSAEGWVWPAGLTEGVLRKAYIETAVSRVNRLTPRPATAHPFEWDGQLWVCVSIEPDASIANVLPVIPAKDFEERYPQYPTSYYPDRAKLSLPATDEGRVQWWTGVVVKVGRKEMAISTAGEMRTLSRPAEDSR